MLPNSKDESFVCDLSSMNLLHYDDWKSTDAVQTLIYFLDAVMTEFIYKTENLFIGRTALHIACEYDNIDTVEELIEANALANIRAKDGSTPLHVWLI